MKILHISKDEKFIESAQKSFQAIKFNESVFCIIKKNADETLIFSKNVVDPLIITDRNFKDLKDIIHTFDVIFFHSYISRFDFILDILRPSQKVIWFCFGMELYNDDTFYSKKQLYDQITYDAYQSDKDEMNSLGKIKNSIRPYYRFFKKDLPFNKDEIKKIKSKHKRKFIDRVDYIAASYREEFESVTKLIGEKKKWLEFWYFPLEFMVDINNKSLEIKENIIIGNSGNPTNNHIDIIEKIKNYKVFSVNEIIFPLSYGDDQHIKSVKNSIDLDLPDKGYAMTNFLSLDEYIKIIENCNVYINNARRQQAVGTIVPIIWFGAKVFLSNRNSFYHYLKRIGVEVSCYETDLNEKSINSGLTNLQIENNRKILFENLNEDLVLEKLKKQIEVI